MSIHRRIDLAFVAWLAIFAVLCHAWMPSISQIRAAYDAAGVGDEICHPGANASKMSGGDETHSSPLEKFGNPHCGYCVSGIAFAAPPAFPALVAVADAPSPAVRQAAIPNLKSLPPLAAFCRGPPAHPV